MSFLSDEFVLLSVMAVVVVGGADGSFFSFLCEVASSSPITRLFSPEESECAEASPAVASMVIISRRRLSEPLDSSIAALGASLMDSMFGKSSTAGNL